MEPFADDVVDDGVNRPASVELSDFFVAVGNCGFRVAVGSIDDGVPVNVFGGNKDELADPSGLTGVDIGVGSVDV